MTTSFLPPSLTTITTVPAEDHHAHHDYLSSLARSASHQHRLLIASHVQPAAEPIQSSIPHPALPINGGRENSISNPDQSSRYNRLSLATIARDKTNNVLSNLSIRTKVSSTSLQSSYAPTGLYRQTSSGSLAAGESLFRISGQQVSVRHPRGNQSSLISRSDIRNAQRPEAELPKVTLERNPTDRRRLLDRSPSPTLSASLDLSPAGPYNKMHQTSSRLLRMTDEERPFTRDFKDLFSTLMVSLPLTAHRLRFVKLDHTFTSEEAINNLGSLKFSQSNRMPDPKDPSRIVTTTTTTTFSMAKEMARSVCQRFMDARFIEAVDGKVIPQFPLKGALWQLTPKGMHVLSRFCQRNGINQRHVLDLLDSPRSTMQLVILERDPATDKLSHDRATIEVIFRRFAGQDGPNVKANISTSDSDSLSDYYNGLVGVKMAKERKIGEKTYGNTFTGKAAVDWLMDCCTTVDRRETFAIAESFVTQELILPLHEDKQYQRESGGAIFQPTKYAIYAVTDKGKIIAGWVPSSAVNGDTRSEVSGRSGGTRADGRSAPRDSNNNRLTLIVNDAALRLLFREYLRDTHCEENLAFYLEVREFTKAYDNSERLKAFTRLDAIRESLAQAYGKSSSPHQCDILHSC